MVIPIPPNGDTTAQSVGGSGNAQPQLAFTEPAVDIDLALGDTTIVSWAVSDSDSNARYTILLDADSSPNNGNEVVLASGFEDDIGGFGSVTLDTAGLTPGTYYLRGIVTDDVNPTVSIPAGGRLLLLPAGMQPTNNRPPFAMVVEPSVVHGVRHRDSVSIRWCANDPDTEDVANVLILLDLDQVPDNDVRFQTQAEVDAVCRGTFPRQVNGAILLACATGRCDPTDVAQMPVLTLTIDATRIPPRTDGLPYRVRIDVTDQQNRTVRAYAPGGISVLATVSESVVDVGQIGRTLAGATFQGFDAGGRTGHAFTRVPDVDQDGADEFVIVSQFGRPFESGPVGSAAMPFGRANARFGGVVSLNSVGTLIDGIVFTNSRVEASDGIHSVSFVDDLSNDGAPELLFGLPFVQAWEDWHDDTPCNAGNTCYRDLLPNPYDPGEPPITRIGQYDAWEDIACVGTAPFVCSNDFDLGRQTPIMGGYMVYVDSINLFTQTPGDETGDDPQPPTRDRRSGTINLTGIGWHEGNSSGSFKPNPGARFRGAWYEFDATQVDWPYRIVPTTRFGETVASMPPLSDGWDNHAYGRIPGGSGGQWLRYDEALGGSYTDARPEILTSGPMAVEGRGQVVLTFGQDIVNYDPNDNADMFNSIPHYHCVETVACSSFRSLTYPGFRMFVGGSPGDHLGYADAAGDFNLDGNQDILMGAPGADRSGFMDNGLVYILFGRIDIGNIDFSSQNPPRVEIHGVSHGEEVGRANRYLSDINGDSLADIGIGVPQFDANGLNDSGMVAVVFGGRMLTGENIFNITQIGTNQLPGVRFLGTQENGLAGAHIASAGDFNADGFGDLLIVASNEVLAVGGQLRRGVVYLVFGGLHLHNQIFLLSQVGTTQLPGMVFISPFATGTAEEAPLECAEAAGDVDGDGFSDILIGAPTADFVNPAAPSQRRLDSGEAYLIYGTNAISLVGG
ncbi:MAG: FG-GAP repeat protein [Phycisphaerae bacterium]|nr:FG-GAP repeat protein [Phycisphaerae bacterium]